MPGEQLSGLKEAIMTTSIHFSLAPQESPEVPSVSHVAERSVLGNANRGCAATRRPDHRHCSHFDDKLDPDARLQVIIKSIKILDDHDWEGQHVLQIVVLAGQTEVLSGFAR